MRPLVLADGPFCQVGMRTSLNFGILCAFALATRNGLCLNVTVPTSPPASARQILPSYVSFSIEQDRWTDWVGTTSPNPFFYNVLDNLKQFTGQPPQIRIGGDSEDHTDFNSDVQFSQASYPPANADVPYPEAAEVVVGDDYYQTVQFLPPGTHVIWGLNFGKANLTAAYLSAQSILKAFASPAVKSAGIMLDGIEIGNEADLYAYNGLRQSTYTVMDYVNEWTAFARNITESISLASSRTRLWAAAFANTTPSTLGFSPQAVLNERVLASVPGSLISTISQHHYGGSFCTGSSGLLQDLMEKTSIRSNLSQFVPDIVATNNKGLDYVLGETNSYSCHGAPGVSNTAGAAIWALDYLLYASQLGISRIFFHQGIGFKYNLVQPVALTRSILNGSTLVTPLQPHVQAQYYAAVIAAEAIGPSGNTTVVELFVDDDRIAGYAFYETSILAKVMLINSQAYLSTDAARPAVHIDLNSMGNAILPVLITVKRLFVPHADDTSGLVWGGQTYETADGKVSGVLEVEVRNATNGIDIQASEVVLLSF
ncbi:hypothetical protein CVT26_001994 [Gymnopilus dilepis]|uniref:Beta-glucuronidase C-terminal domain-containing protein n=1 Tax=Gymnopilus dilepis TaxID=231916 RepID=A0A409VC36_9AGAR|nr:hypothetical protein CVT26_001994 [Gymnopilus dilepis]